jgi:hypothetical protein
MMAGIADARGVVLGLAIVSVPSFMSSSKAQLAQTPAAQAGGESSLRAYVIMATHLIAALGHASISKSVRYGII